jgi:hypothetical protein
MKISFWGLSLGLALMAGCATQPDSVRKTSLVSVPITPNPETSPGEMFSLLPQAAQKTVTTQTGASEIRSITKVLGSDRDVYEVRFRYAGASRTIYVAADGTLVNTAPGTGPGLVGKLPEAVQKVVQGLGPDSIVTDVQTQQHTLYEITFKDPAIHHKIFVTEAGTVFTPQ